MKPLLIVSVALVLTGCFHDNNNNNDGPMVRTFMITVTNLTNNQPMSPPGAILHAAGFSAWMVGSAASDELEQLAEGGDVAPLLALQPDAATFQANAPVGPGGSLGFSLETTEAIPVLTLATMLVNTNDGFTGLSGSDLSSLAVGESQTWEVPAYDAGTEFNSESAGTMPGPADGGEGFNVDLDDVTGVVTYHGGVVSKDDGNTDSVLDQSHRFDNPVLRISVTRL